MSVSDPLIKELKGWTRKLTECKTEINDSNINLPSFCKSLERCFQKGVVMRMNAIGFPKLPEAWFWMEEITDKNQSLSYSYTSAVQAVKENPRLRSPSGRLRLLIRICLSRKCLHVPVQILLQNTPLLANEFYEPHSILGDEILTQILLSVLLQSTKLNFNLNLKNASFLDDTWQLPECSALELVPCKTLGISVSFIEGKALVVNLEENSVAAEDDKIEVGDVLDEINGNVITASAKGRLGKIMKRAIGRPISIHVVKHRYKQSRDFYGPIVSLIQSSGIEHMKRLLLRSPVPKNEQNEDPPKLSEADLNGDDNLLKPGFHTKYCGSISTGTEGDVKQIEKAIWRLLRSGDIHLTPVRFECLEIGIRVTREVDENVLMKHSYMEISSCGRTANISDYFAYIAGDTNCNVATNFNAYVFFHQNEDDVQTILQSLGQGFQRTHFAV
ncbi:uncharacterized protein LOC105686328 isoform X1 [Athalia rosae]|uniref:uncharacterized protein LOC105686328 isoform X1 n=2 Tax=Athalia rosae TaxID=37344 RepID=UPI00203337AF|nr:uncharacterized protein LOC105686328 isoform X1 [Athalia rosae]